jgi:DNA replication and repair protein RecF
MIHSLWIKSFRCLTENLITFQEEHSFVSIVAQNNVGKTSFLEACYVLGNLESFVTSNLANVVPFNEESSTLGIKVSNQLNATNYYLKIDREGKKYITVNDKVVRSRQEILSLFRANYISSDSLFFITSQPSFRRLKLDQTISQVSITYRKNMATYKRLYAQKNKLLKTNPDIVLIKQLNQLIAPLIFEIQKERFVYLNEIQSYINRVLRMFTFPIKDVSIQYQSRFADLNSADEIKVFLSTRIEKERMAQHCLYGPHRDDYLFIANDRIMKEFYSRGVCRIISYFFQLSQSHLIEQYTKLPMMILLDEPFSEIYKDLKHDLIHLIPNHFTKIYTSTQQDEITSLKDSDLYGINDGHLCKI